MRLLLIALEDVKIKLSLTTDEIIMRFAKAHVTDSRKTLLSNIQFLHTGF